MVLKLRTPPKILGLDDVRLYALSGIGVTNGKPETSVVEQRSYQPSCRHAICAPEDAVQRSGQRSTVMVVILIGVIGSVAEVRHADR